MAYKVSDTTSQRILKIVARRDGNGKQNLTFF
ncbi:hypothetical protein CCACVL1_02143 [Corchorus capsularis]|uniref:Uncharacterized protein n=1 Tax=Corchorus capsularis TaxID=210143 RepID=A0A1R3KCF9_COCAP|nr:hypothetical protein CCACVL1_02143 [Corchorus capsularis]